MKKAVAFVTDEGGVTCHAAIVSREMKKPCIIGTRTATKTLKDGDIVEVDAEKGIVKILKEYSVLGITPVFKEVVDKDFTAFFGGKTLSTLYFVVRNGTFYHFQIDKEVEMLAKIFLERVRDGKINLKELFSEYDRNVSKLEKIYKTKSSEYNLLK